MLPFKAGAHPAVRDMTDMDLSCAVWRRSSRSNNGGNCVEAAGLSHFVAVRDS
ncbi:DUF397 domain-containing protein [Spirillospora sp. NPDC047418]|jgi:hypothetical protein